MISDKDEFRIEQYVLGAHDVGELSTEQNLAVEFGEAQMLPWKTNEGEIIFPDKLPLYVALTGGVAIAGAGFNIHYRGTKCLELGGAYVAKEYRGKGIYHMLTEARLSYALEYGFDILSFANKNSYPILKSDFGFSDATKVEVPAQAFDLCAGCEDNPKKGSPACIDTCCDRETIVVLRNNELTDH